MGDEERSDPDDVDPTSQSLRELGSEMGLGSIVAHLYRGEMDRVVNWRTRLDNTTNFAVTVIGALLAYAFSSDSAGHTIVLVAVLIGTRSSPTPAERPARRTSPNSSSGADGRRFRRRPRRPKQRLYAPAGPTLACSEV